VAEQLTPEEAAQRALHLLETGDTENGLALALALAEQCPTDMSVLYVAGQACWQTGRRDEAVHFQRRLIACDPGNAVLHRNLVELLLRMEDREGVAAAVDGAMAAGAEDPTMINAGGLAHYHLGRSDAALTAFRRVVELYPDHAQAHQNISVVLMDRGDGEAAVAAYAKSLTAWRPDDTAEPAAEVAGAYDDRAATYNETELHQYFGRTMAAFVTDHVDLGPDSRLLDVACGTGAVARYLPRFGGRLVGVDLSPAMLTSARGEGLYAELRAGDMVTAMNAMEETFDVIICCCALYHLNDLMPFFTEAARLMAPGGQLFISVDPSSDDFDIAVTSPDEYAHSRPYLRQLAAASGLAEREIRIMNHRMMPGFWAAFQKPA